ncbi:hypothetical protein STEG23_028104 [Scotinomys teguina]
MDPDMAFGGIIDSDITMTTSGSTIPEHHGYTQTTDIHVAFSGNTGHRHQHGLSCSKTMDPDQALSSSIGLDITMAPVAVQATNINVARSSSLAHEQQHGFKLQQSSWTYTWFSGVTQAMDIKSDSSCNTTSDSDMTLGSSPDPNTTRSQVAVQPIYISLLVEADWPTDMDSGCKLP